MRKSNRLILAVTTFSLPLLLAGCASKPVEAPPVPAAPKIVSGDQMFRDSQGIAQLGSRWQEGKQMVDKGQALQRQGQAEIDQGQSLITEGQKIMQESEEGYKNLKQ
ncbi:MAG: hypothetical protein PHW13_10920 [Methylococcales bacterium]|nr:hypothetical protein [Methylococcales bacterium]